MRISSVLSLAAARRLTSVLVLSAALSPAFALPVMEMRAEDLLPMAAELKKSLNLNPNQQTLWLQTEAKTRNVLRERQARRERLQTAIKTGAAATDVELRDLGKALDEETTTSANEEKLLREWWLVVNDALNESQRQAVARAIGEELMRVPDAGRAGGGEPRKDEGGQHKGGGGRKGGMGGGMGGMGGSVGPGGASISLPGG